MVSKVGVVISRSMIIAKDVSRVVGLIASGWVASSCFIGERILALAGFAPGALWSVDSRGVCFAVLLWYSSWAEVAGDGDAWLFQFSVLVFPTGECWASSVGGIHEFPLGPVCRSSHLMGGESYKYRKVYKNWAGFCFSHFGIQG